jgi:ABC-type Fe3+/spermidine/putrescine transport system ATPase subunit
MIRPEALTLASGTGGAGDNRLAGVVEEAVYLGEAVRYTVRAGELALVVRAPRRGGEPSVAPGSAVTVGWAREATVLIPE